MPKIPPCSRAELIRKLRSLGFEDPYSGGKHSYMKRGRFRLTIPNPHGKDVSGVFIARILRQADIDPDDWLD